MPVTRIQNPQLEGDPFYWPGGETGVLLIHGYTATTAEVRPLARCLAAAGYTVSGPLLPGHYTSPEDANRYRWQDWVAAVEQGYAELAKRCREVVIGGESTGALLALYLAAGHPEAAAVLCYAPALRLAQPRWRQTLLSLLAPFVPVVPKGPMDDDSLWQGYTVYPLRGARELLRLQRAVCGRLAEVRQPILIMQGRLDRTVAPEAPDLIYQRVRSTVKEMHWLDRSAHCVIIDRERDAAEAVTLRFLERVTH